MVRSRTGRSVLAALVIASAGTPAVLLAQDAPASVTQDVDDANDDDGFDLGWLGLAGLLGLLGLKRRDTHVHHDTTRRV